MRYRKIKMERVIFLILCLLLVFNQRPTFSETLKKNSCSPASLPSELFSLAYHNVDTINGSVQYINEEYMYLAGSNLYTIKQLIYGYGKMSTGEEGKFYKKLKDSVIGFGIGFKQYIVSPNQANLWYGGSVNVAYQATNLKTPNESKSTTELSGLLMGNIGYTWFFKENLAIEIMVGLSWPSVYPKPGYSNDLYASPFFGIGLAFIL